MAYQVYDGTKHIGEGPSSNGMTELHQFILTIPDKDAPNLYELLEHGYSSKPTGLAVEIKRYISKATGGVKSTLEKLLQQATKAKDILIIAD